MRLKVERILESLLIVGLLMPAGMLLGAEIHQPPAVTSSNAKWYDVEQASNLFSRMQTLATHVKSHLAAIEYQEFQIPWQLQAVSLNKGRREINRISNDLQRLDAKKNGLEPWQRSLMRKVAPNVHEMAYQMDAAINRLNAHKDDTALAATVYPQNINRVYTNAGQMASTITTVTHYARAEENMAALDQAKANERS